MFLLPPHLKAASWHLELWGGVVKTAPGHWLLSDSLNDGVWPWWLHVKWTNCNHKSLNEFLQRTYLSSHHPAQINNRNLYAFSNLPSCLLSVIPTLPKGKHYSDPCHESNFTSFWIYYKWDHAEWIVLYQLLSLTILWDASFSGTHESIFTLI